MDSIFEFASKGQHEKFIESLSNYSKKEQQEIVNHQYEGVSIFIAACIGGSIEIVSYIVESFKVDVNSLCDICIDGCPIGKVTPLWCATYYGHLDVVKYLAKNGADLNVTSDNYVNPLRFVLLRNFYHLKKNQNSFIKGCMLQW